MIKKTPTKQTLPIDEEAKKGIIAYLGIEGVEKKKQDEMIAKIGEVAFKQLFVETVGRLSEEKQMEFAELIEEKATGEVMDAFLRETIPDYDEMAQEVISDLMEDLKKAGDASKKE